MRIALIGTRGVPARYGGFETAVEEIGRRLVANGHQVIVFCRGAEGERLQSYQGMELVHLPAVPKKSVETLSHTALSMAHLALSRLVRRRRVDAAIVFNAANAPLLPLLRLQGIPVAVHVDGLEWKRAKWGPIGQRYYKIAERLAVWWA
ncbi:MAG TPA: glycosyltransferase, partial [Microlunatus sp.]